MRKVLAVATAVTLALFVAVSVLTSAGNITENDNDTCPMDPVQIGLIVNSTAYEWMHAWMGDANTTLPMDYNYSYESSWNEGGSCIKDSARKDSTLLAQDN